MASLDAMYSSEFDDSLARRFWAKVNKTDACWLWTGFCAPYNGYGKLRVGGKFGIVAPAHRVSWKLHFGPIPEGLTVHHRCDNPPCVRPDHLWIGTHAENMRDRDVKGRSASATLTTVQVREVRQLYRAGVNRRLIASRFGISLITVYDIASRRTWVWA